MSTITERIRHSFSREHGLADLLFDEGSNFPEKIQTQAHDFVKEERDVDSNDRALYHGALAAGWVMAVMDDPFATDDELKSTAKSAAIGALWDYYGVSGAVTA